MTTLEQLFATPKPLIAMCHARAMPGRPLHDDAMGMEAVVAGLAHDVEVLQSSGVDGLLFCNEQDLPYQLDVGPEVVAGMSAVIGELRPRLRLPYGVDVAWDARAALAVARATRASFVRQVFTGVYDTDMGLLAPRSGDLAAYRRQIGATAVAIFAHVTPEFGKPVSGRSIAERTRGARFFGVDALLVSGLHTGVETDLADLREAKQAAGDTPVLVSSGVTQANVKAMLDIADGIIVGTSLKVDGDTWNPIDPDRVGRLVTEVQQARSHGAVA
jgi:membrane complex biogenesis BtpA family protein